MQQRQQKKKLSRNEKRAVREIAQQTAKQAVAQKPQSKPKAQKRKNKGRRQSGRKVSMKRRFLDALLYPDIVGPTRFPREGGSARTSLGYTQTIAELKLDAVNNVIMGLQLGTIHTASGATFNTANYSTNFTSTSLANAVVCPVATQIEDLNLTSGSIVISYTGKPADAAGEILLYLGPQITSSMSYSLIRFYPGTRIISCSELVNKGAVRVSLTHVSPLSWEFIAPSESGQDFNTPAVFWWGGTVGSTISVEVNRFFEYRPLANATQSSVYPASEAGYSADLAAFADANAEIGSVLNTVTAGEIPSSVNYLPSSVTGIATLAGAAIGLRSVQRWGHQAQGLPFYEPPDMVAQVKKMSLKDTDEKSDDDERDIPESKRESVSASSTPSSARKR